MTNELVVELKDKSIFISKEKGNKGTVIAIHGLTGSHKNMVHYTRHLAEHYNVISVDLRGRGNSSALGKTPSIYQHAEDILELIDTLHIDNPIILGHSMGAFIASLVASKLPSTRAVILLDGAATMSEHQNSIVQPSLGRLSKHYASKDHYIEEIQAIYNRLGVTWTADVKACVEYEVHAFEGHWENRSDEAAIRTDWESFYAYNPEAIFSAVDCPVLLVYAEGKNGQLPPLFYLTDYDTTQKVAKNITTTISPCNHYTMVFEKRPEILNAIDDFLQQL